MHRVRTSGFDANWEHNFKLCTKIFKTGFSFTTNRRVAAGRSLYRTRPPGKSANTTFSL